MIKLSREDIYIISRHSNWQKNEVSKAFKEHVYSPPKDWRNFLGLFLASLGTGFTVVGIVFFFAYNWADLHKFIKFALVECMVVATVVVMFIPNTNAIIRNIVLTGAAFLVGVLFAVLGQVYQTGANTYDFFLAWTLFILLWVVVADFAPLWLLFLILVNTTFVFYTAQTAHQWSEVWFFTLLFLINTMFLIGAVLIPVYRQAMSVPTWWTNIVALAAIFCATMGITTGMFSNREGYVLLGLILLVGIVYVLGAFHALRIKNVFYLAIIAFSLIVIVSAWLIKVSGGFEIFLIVSSFVVLSTTLTVKLLIELQKAWSNEK